MHGTTIKIHLFSLFPDMGIKSRTFSSAYRMSVFDDEVKKVSNMKQG